jgi:hypothetical protein
MGNAGKNQEHCQSTVRAAPEHPTQSGLIGQLFQG